MIPQKQLFLHKPSEGRIGDCWRTALACVLDMQAVDVPHFMEPFWGLEDSGTLARYAINAWLRQHCGLQLVEIAWNTDSITTVFDVMSSSAPGMFYLLSGTSRNGTNHTVVARDGEIVCDPAIDDSGIVGPMDCGQFQAAFLVPTRFFAGQR